MAYRFIPFDDANDWNSYTVSGSGNTLTSVTKAVFLSETGITDPGNLPDNIGKVVLAQAATVTLTSPTFSPAVDFTSGDYRSLAFRYFIDQANLDKLTDSTTLELRLHTDGSNRRNIDDWKANTGATRAGFNSINLSENMLSQATPTDPNIVDPAGGTGTYNPASVTYFFNRLFAASTGVTMYLIDYVQNPVNVPRVIFTWDDGDDTQYDNMFSLAQTSAIPGTLFVVGTSIDSGGSMSAAEVQAMTATGLFEVGTHGLNLANHGAGEGYADLTEAEVKTDVAEQQAAMAAKGVATEFSNKILSWPLGQRYETTDSATIYDILTSLGYKAGRAGIEMFGHGDFFQDPMNIPAYALGQGAGFVQTQAELVTHLNNLQDAGGDMVITGHKVVTSAPTGNQVLDTDLSGMFATCRARADKGLIKLMTMSEYLTEIGAEGFVDESSASSGIMQPIMASGY